MTETDNDGRTLAERYLRGLNDHDPDAVDGFVALDYVNHNAYVTDGREANREWWSTFFTAFPDIKATMDDLVVAGDRVVGRFTYRGTHTGPLYGVPATGKADRDAFDRHLAHREREVRGALGRAQLPRVVEADLAAREDSRSDRRSINVLRAAGQQRLQGPLRCTSRTSIPT